jgi:hypothetical protein
MAQTKLVRQVSFSLSAKNRAERKEQSAARSALFSASCRRSGLVLNVVKDCSPAEPYPPHECFQSTIPNVFSLTKGTFLLCQKGDISTLG